MGTDKKRERREKKAKKSAIRKNKEAKAALEEAINPGGLGNKFSKARAMTKVEEAGKKVETIKGKKDKALNSSTAFFSSLQDEVKTGAKEKAHAKKKKKALKDLNVASLKL